MNRLVYKKHSTWRIALQAAILCLVILLLLTSGFMLYRLGTAAIGHAGERDGLLASLPTQLSSRNFLGQGALTSLLAFVPGILLAIYLSSYAGTASKKRAQAVLHYLSKLPVLMLWLPLLLPELAAAEQAVIGISSDSIALGAILLFPVLSHQVIKIICALPSGLGQVSATLGVSRRYAITHMLIPMAAPATALAALLLAFRAAGEYLFIAVLFGLPAVTDSATAALPAGLAAITILAAALLWSALLNGLTELLLKVIHHAGK